MEIIVLYLPKSQQLRVAAVGCSANFIIFSPFSALTIIIKVRKMKKEIQQNLSKIKKCFFRTFFLTQKMLKVLVDL
jgi:hypothetical protein